MAEGSVVGEYQIVKQLGRGAFGAVYHATHTVIGKQVALKVLGAQFSEDAAMAARFVDEARAVNRIAHPNIVDIFGFGVLPDGRKYCVMELLRGATLGEHLEKNAPLPTGEVLEILAQIAGALDAAHQSGIVHRDLKPENVFLVGPSSSATSTGPKRADVKVKLLDFGIAQIADGLHQRTGSNMVLGTPAYMSPEQCRGARIDFRSDIYSLGVLAFELFTGEQPFAGVNAFQLTSQHLTAQPPVPSSRRADLPTAVDDVVLAMLAKSPEKRPQSATEAVRQLARAGQGAAAAGVSVSPLSHTGSPAKSKRAVLLLGGAFVLTALAVLGASSLGGKTAPSPSAEPVAEVIPRAAPLPVASAPLAAAPAAAEVVTVTLRVSGEPTSARVFRDTRELSRLGEPFQVERSETPVTLTIKAPGYAERALEVVPSQNRDLRIALKRLGKPAKHTAELEY